ncbi:uncharacterized protein LOC119662759 [Teleopsis dalmanni]|uniref:uncharacterized protein LOC119662759 n=1 Tax=Teleopsis dalmanni TaxID=139649 RepID=UPI0018CD7629|nr:uncharacterized protein LOC119662759 [Teleopsis dalmanni]
MVTIEIVPKRRRWYQKLYLKQIGSVLFLACLICVLIYNVCWILSDVQSKIESFCVDYFDNVTNNCNYDLSIHAGLQNKVDDAAAQSALSLRNITWVLMYIKNGTSYLFS